MSVAEAAARTQRFARALELLAEMPASVGLQETNGIPVTIDVPADHWSQPVEDRTAWLIANPTVYAEPGDPEQLAAAIERAHQQWKASTK
ncbi:MAG: hypothetical protein ACRBN8_22630 [Nannocystales bacterium]